MLLNILQCVEQPPTTKNYLLQDGVKVAKYWLRKTVSIREEGGICKHPLKTVELNGFGNTVWYELSMSSVAVSPLEGQ